MCRLVACAIVSCERGGTVDCDLSLDAEQIRLVVRARNGGVASHSVPHVLESAAGALSNRNATNWQELGLTSVRSLVARHGGSVRVEIRDPPAEAVFTLTLPGDHLTGSAAS